MILNKKNTEIVDLLKLAIADLQKKELNNADDINEIQGYISNNEFGLAFEHLLYSIYENDIAISQIEYERIEKIANSMDIKKEEYEYVKKLIR